MKIYTSKNIIISSRKEVERTYDDINHSRNKFDSDFNKIESSVKKRINEMKNAVNELKKEIELAKKVIDENQQVCWKLEEEKNKVIQKMADVDWNLSQEKSRHIPKPAPSDDPDTAKKNNEAYAQACRQQEENIKNLQDAWFNLRDYRDQLGDRISQIQKNEGTLKNIIYENELEISRVEYEARDLEEKLNNLKSAINNFKSEISDILGKLNSVFSTINSALNYLNQSFEKFKEANIYFDDNEVISITDINLVFSKLDVLRKKINDTYTTGDLLNSRFVHANNKLKDNIMTESGKYISEIRKSCDEVIDSLKRMEEIIAAAMQKLLAYANLG